MRYSCLENDRIQETLFITRKAQHDR